MKEEIQTYDARKISPDIRESVEELLKKNRDSFDPKVMFEHVREKTNNLGSDQVRHKPACIVTEAG